MSEPDWSESKTGALEIWKNPLISMEDRLEIADGAISFRDEQLKLLRHQLEECQANISRLEEERDAYKERGEVRGLVVQDLTQQVITLKSCLPKGNNI